MTVLVILTSLTLLSLCRLEPHRASFRLSGEGQPHAEFVLQQRGGRGEDVEAPGRELRAEARRDRWHERRPAALREGEHGGLQHPRPPDPPGPDREAGRRGVALLGRAGQRGDGGGCRSPGQQHFSQPVGLYNPMPVSIPALRQRLKTVVKQRLKRLGCLTVYMFVGTDTALTKRRHIQYTPDPHHMKNASGPPCAQSFPSYPGF